MNRVVSTAAVFYFLVSATFALIMVAGSSWVLTHFFHSSAHNAGLQDMYYAVVGGFSVSLTFSVLQSLIIGVQRADVQAGLTLAYNLLNAGGTVAVLLLGLGLKGLAVNWVGTAVIVTIGGNWIAGQWLYPALRLNPARFSLAELKRILRFSTKVQVSILAIFLNGQVDRILITYALGTRSLGFYGLAQRATASLTGFSSALTSTVLPAVSEMATTHQWERVRQVYIRATRYQAMTVFPVTAALCGLAFPIVHAWLGPDFDRVAITMILLVASYAVYLPNGATVAALNGIGRPDVRMRGDVVLVLVHIPLAALLIWRFGYFGTVAVTSSLLVTSRIYIFLAGGRQLRTPFSELLRKAFLQPAVGTLLALASVLVAQVLIRSNSLAVLAAECLLFGAVYFGYMVFFGFDDQDVSLIKMALRRLIPVYRRADA